MLSSFKKLMNSLLRIKSEQLETRDFKTEFDNLIKEKIGSIFKAYEFKKNANNFYRATPDLIQTFITQKSQWNSKDDISFTFHICFFNNALFLKTCERPMPIVPKIYDCFISLGTKWYTLNSTVLYDKLISEIELDIQKSAICIFEKYQTLNSLPGLIKEHPVLLKTMNPADYFAFLMEINSKKEAMAFLTSEYKEAHIPKSSSSTIVYPNGKRVETKLEPKINKGYIETLTKIAEKYNIKLDKKKA